MSSYIFKYLVLFMFAINTSASDTSGQLTDTALRLMQTKRSDFKKGRKIFGLVVFKDKNSEYPVKAQPIVLLDKGRVLLSSSTHLNGEFEIYGSLKEGHYKLQINSDFFFCEQDVLIPSEVDKYKIICVRKGH